ncbi:MAG TPA: hypothetical protein RMF84_10745, partial [Polyangiaceae bacterium LLY-WYZ-14_1]|nr:hypothetical protein [Polyangiaceae bacterium LLY-WYZ-14_1]
GTRCVPATGRCGQCVEVGGEWSPGEVCCDGSAPVRDPLDPTDPTLYCREPCNDRGYLRG